MATGHDGELEVPPRPFAGLELSLLRSAAIAFTDTFFLAVSSLGALALAGHLSLEGDRRRRKRNLALAALLALGSLCSLAALLRALRPRRP